MIILTEICVRTNRFKESKQHRLFDFDPTYLWQWSNFLDYVIFLVGFWFILTVITFLASSSRKKPRFYLI